MNVGSPPTEPPFVSKVTIEPRGPVLYVNSFGFFAAKQLAGITSLGGVGIIVVSPSKCVRTTPVSGSGGSGGIITALPQAFVGSITVQSMSQSAGPEAVSQTSSGSTRPLPQLPFSIWQLFEHPSPLLPFPSSQLSFPTMYPSPQVEWHAASQPLSTTPPPSQSSTGECTRPSPQAAILHIVVQAPVSEFRSARSQVSSLLACVNPSPQSATLHIVVQAPLSLLSPPRSQASLLLTCVNPSPHEAFLHIVVQAPVSSFDEPRSHSSPVSVFPFPHAGFAPPPPVVPPPVAPVAPAPPFPPVDVLVAAVPPPPSPYGPASRRHADARSPKAKNNVAA